MHINKIRIMNYKSFLDSGEVAISKDIFAFIGQNNTGKSTILDGIQAFFPNSKKSITGADYHKNTIDDIIIEVWFNEVDESYLEEKLYKDKLFKQVEKIRESYEKYHEEPIKKNLDKYEKMQEKLEELKKNEFDSAVEKYKIENDVLYIKMIVKKGSSIRKSYLNKADEEIKEAELKKILPEIKVIPALRDPKNESTAGSNSYLKDLIQMLDEEAKTNIEVNGKTLTYSELNRVLSDETKKRCDELANKITTLYNNAIGSNDYNISIDSSVNISKGTSYSTTIIDKTTGVSNDILSCGTGYQSMIILAILETYVQISQSQNHYILLIEEPEVYLHPTLQRKMIDTLIRISESNQVIFTSHSPITVSKLSNSDVRLIEKVNGAANVSCISPKSVIDELGIKADDILFSKGIIFVEGIDDYTVISELINKIDSKMNGKINVIQTHSCKNLKFYANAELLMNMHFDIPIIILRDADIDNPERLRETSYEEIAVTLLEEPQYADLEDELVEEVKDKLRSSIHVLNEHSLEYYFVDDEFLNRFIEDKEKMEFALKCYECQYRYQLDEAKNGNNQKNNFESCFQPKRLLKGFPDAKAWEREKKEEALRRRWLQASENCQCDNKYKIDNFLEIRNQFLENIKKFQIQGNNLYEFIIRNNDIESLKDTKLNEFIQLLEKFIGRINM